MSLSPAVILYDANGVEMAVQDGVAIPVGTRGVIIAGSDGTNSRFVRTASDGTVRVDPTGTTTQPVSGSVSVSNFPAVQPVNDNGGSLTIDGTVAVSSVSGSVAVTGPLTDTQLRATPVPISGTVTANAGTGPWPVTDNGGSLTIDGTVTALQGAAPWTQRLQDGAGSNLLAVDGSGRAAIQNPPNLDVALSTRATEATLSSIDGKTPALDAGKVPVSDGGGSLTIDGTITANAGTNLNTSALALETTLAAQSLVDNSGFIDGTTRVQPAGFILDETAGTALTENDAAAARIDSKRAQVHVIEDATTRGQRATVKPASTAAVGADTALVVAVSPNNTVGITMAAGSYGGQVEGRAADGAAVVGNPVLVAGFDGANAQTILTDSNGRVVLAPAGAGSTKGFAAGEVVLAATTIVPIRATTYTEQSSNATRSVASSSANDTSAGTGARTVRITYYTATMTGPFTTDVTMNGTTAVATSVSDICFIEKIEVLTVGSTGSNVGIITLYVNNAGGGGTIWTIAATANQTKGAHHYCPTGKTCYITGLLVGIKGADTTSGFIRAKDPTSSVAAELQVSDVVRAPSSGQSFRSYGTAIAVAGPSRITVFAAPDSTSSRTYYGSFDYYEE